MVELHCAAILFDMDGVLVDSQAVVKRTWRRWCKRTGLDEATVLGAAHGRRTMDTLRSVAPHLDLSIEARWLEQAELGDRDGIVAVPGAKELTSALPDRAASDLGVDAARCLVIEDSPAGIQAARAAGMSVIALTTTHEADELPSIEIVLPDLVEIEVRGGGDCMGLRMGGG